MLDSLSYELNVTGEKEGSGYRRSRLLTAEAPLGIRNPRRRIRPAPVDYHRKTRKRGQREEERALVSSLFEFSSCSNKKCKQPMTWRQSWGHAFFSFSLRLRTKAIHGYFVRRGCSNEQKLYSMIRCHARFLRI